MSEVAKRRVELACATLGGLVFVLGYLRYATFHNRTFDLAFYVRMSWGLARHYFSDPMVGAHYLGLHLSPVLWPLGQVGRLLGTPTVLLATQSIGVACAAWPLARIGARRFGDAGAYLGAAMILLHPNTWLVATYEFHPGTLAILPLAWGIDAVDRGCSRTLIGAAIGVLACREDLALSTLLLGVIAAASAPGLRRVGFTIAAASLAYFAIFAFLLHPHFRPAVGSMQLHFGKWGDTTSEALVTVLTRPDLVLAHLATADRSLYLPKVLGTFALLPLLRPRWLVLAAPVLAMNLLSEFPTTTNLDSHYLTPALPALAAAALEGASAIRERVPSVIRIAWAALVVSAACGLALLDVWAFVPDATTRAGLAVVAQIPGDVAVQAPYEILPHVAGRHRVHFPVPPDRGCDYTVLDVRHRARFLGRGDLMRTAEEPIVRDWLTRPDQGLIVAQGPYLLFQRGLPARDALGGTFLVGHADPTSGVHLTRCLRLRDARLDDSILMLDLIATEACPADLALRLGDTTRARRIDLLFGGLLSPALLERGDLARSSHALSPEEIAAFRRGRLRVGLVRSSGARPEHEDPMSVPVR